MLRAILLTVALTLITAPVVAGTWEDAVVAAVLRDDYETALRLLHPLAEQGDAGAQTLLGVMYDKGDGVPQDYAEAVKWYRKAAEQGNDLAQSNLGFMYFNGLGVPQDYAEAVRWYRMAAEQGLARAQLHLGTMYFLGNGVPQDVVLAYMWFNIAVAQGQNEASLSRDEVAKHMNREQVAEAQRLAREWKPK